MSPSEPPKWAVPLQSMNRWGLSLHASMHTHMQAHNSWKIIPFSPFASDRNVEFLLLKLKDQLLSSQKSAASSPTEEQALTIHSLPFSHRFFFFHFVSPDSKATQHSRQRQFLASLILSSSTHSASSLCQRCDLKTHPGVFSQCFSQSWQVRLHVQHSRRRQFLILTVVSY